jgi:hypothetical protein
VKQTVPFPRQFQEGDEGTDCRAVKRALAAFFHGPNGMNLKTDTFAQAAGTALVHFKTSHHLLADPIYTLEAHQQLIPYFDELGGKLMNDELAYLTAVKLRDDYVTTHRWFIAHASLVLYSFLRPIPEGLTPFETTQPILTDCSGLIELGARWTPGCPDPSKLGFSGYGNTGTLLSACTKVEQEHVQPADLAWFGRNAADDYGEHAITILSTAGSVGEWETSSNGYIGDPIAHTFGQVQAALAEAGYPFVWFLRFLPAIP